MKRLSIFSSISVAYPRAGKTSEETKHLLASALTQIFHFPTFSLMVLEFEKTCPFCLFF